MEGKIISVWGSPNSGKTIFATSLATTIYDTYNTPSEHLKKLLTRSGVPKSEIVQFID